MPIISTRPLVINYYHALVPLTQGKHAIIDLDDVHIAEGRNWYANKIHRIFYAKCGERLLHRDIMQPSEGMEVDHINCNGLDNRRKNLRIATSQQNRHNSRRNLNNASGFKGVSWNSKAKRWQATIWINNRNKNLGYFNSPDDAARAYNTAARILHGEFAHLNFPDGTS